MPYSCRNNNDYKSAYKMGMSTTRELCGLCLDNVIQEKGRRRSARCSSSSSALSCTGYARQQICGCRSRSSSQGRSRHSTALLSAAEAIVDSLCNTGASSSSSSTDHKVHSSTSHGSHRSKHTRSPDPRSRLENSVAFSNGIDAKASNGSTRNRDKKQGRSTPTHSLAVIEYKRDQHPALQDDTLTDNDTDRASRATFDTIETDAATYEKKKSKDSSTMILVDGVSRSGSQSNINHTSTQQSQQEPNRKVIDLTKHSKKGSKGPTDSLSQNSQKSLFDDNSSTISILSSQDEIQTGKDDTKEYATVSGKQINKFLQNLSKEQLAKRITGESSPYPTVEEAPSNLPPLKFDPPHYNPTSTDRSSGDESRDDASNDNPYSRPVPICSRIHHFGKNQEDSCLIDKNDSSKLNDDTVTGTLETDPAESDDDDDEDDITGPRLARSGTLETLDTSVDYADATSQSAMVMSCTSTKSMASTATPGASNARNTRNRIPTPRYSQADPAPFSPKSRKELYVVKEKLQMTQNKLEATQYELTVLKGIKDLYQRELECKALECKLAEWRLSHKPLAIEAAPTTLTSAASAAEESHATSTAGGQSTASSNADSDSSTAEHPKAITSGPQTSTKPNQATLPTTYYLNGKYIRIAITSTFVGVMMVLGWHYYSEISVMTRHCCQELRKAAVGHPVVQAAINGGYFAEAWKLLQSSARQKVRVYAEATRTFLALLYWMVRGIIWYASDVDINDFGVLLKHMASELQESAVDVALLLSHVPEKALEKLSTLALNAVVR